MEVPGRQIASLIGVFFGGVAGTAARIGCDRALAITGWPVSTFVVNIAGALALGVVTARWHDPAHRLRLFLGVGFLGAFTTYSALAGQTVSLASGHASGAALYLGGSVVVGLLAAMAGLWIGGRSKPQ